MKIKKGTLEFKELTISITIQSIQEAEELHKICNTSCIMQESLLPPSFFTEISDLLDEECNIVRRNLVGSPHYLHRLRATG